MRTTPAERTVPPAAQDEEGPPQGPGRPRVPSRGIRWAWLTQGAAIRSLSEKLRPIHLELSDVDVPGAVERIQASHQARSVRMQSMLRVVIIVSIIVDMVVFPPRERPVLSIGLMVVYEVWALGMLMLAWRDRLSPRAAWSVLLVDLPAVTLLLGMAGTFTDPNWTSPLSADAYVLLALLAAFQLRPAITAVTGVTAAVTYTLSSAIGHSHASPDLHYNLVHAAVILVVTLISVLISWVQQSRVGMIAGLAHHRAWLVANNVVAAERERRDLSEALHDGPLQSVLAARQDIAEAREPGSATLDEALHRADGALQDASVQLRSQVTDLHPAVLEHGGLEQALRGLGKRAAFRGGFTVEVSCDRSSLGHALDALLYHCCRELITNIVKHAQAGRVTIDLVTGPNRVRLEIADDGVGIPDHVLHSRAAEGHIGLASQRIRISDAGGSMEIRPNSPSGTTVTVTVPLADRPDAPGGAGPPPQGR
ncbi:sensor histidine kinase [Kitasatospora mediocidica]|uniref:sensor histidine kinase n=1 Tax=Kitasatospora mediocidica TaxID=58352 RepID=UPI0018DE8A55|nr:ATP-binding protein [Kitasatospora mediocidica]